METISGLLDRALLHHKSTYAFSFIASTSRSGAGGSTHCPSPSAPFSAPVFSPFALSQFPMTSAAPPPPQSLAGVTLTSVLTKPNAMATAAHSSPPMLRSQKNQDAAQLRKSRTFRKIERDLADKSKRLNNDAADEKQEKAEKEASRRNDDQYVDKDRAIAVGAGNNFMRF